MPNPDLCQALSVNYKIKLIYWAFCEQGIFFFPQVFCVAPFRSQNWNEIFEQTQQGTCFLISAHNSIAKRPRSHISADMEHEMHPQLVRKTVGSCLLFLEYLSSHPANCPHVNRPFWGACQMPFKQACSTGLAGLRSSVPQMGTPLRPGSAFPAGPDPSVPSLTVNLLNGSNVFTFI